MTDIVLKPVSDSIYYLLQLKVLNVSKVLNQLAKILSLIASFRWFRHYFAVVGDDGLVLLVVQQEVGQYSFCLKFISFIPRSGQGAFDSGSC